MAKNHSFNYYEFFVEMMDYGCRCAKKLEDTIEEFDHERLFGDMEEIHSIEHGADMIKHNMMDRLLREFLPPIDREDIMALSHKLDDICDVTEDVLIRMHMYDIRSCRPEALEMSKVIAACCAELQVLMNSFARSHKNPELKKHVTEVNRLEEVGDDLYIKATRRLFTDGSDAREIVIWQDIFNGLEACCDACENVADEVESIVLKNS